MKIQKNISLKGYNTFGIDAKAKFFCEINSIEQLGKALQLEGYPRIFVISGGSNILLTKDIDALVLYINLKGITLLEESSNHVILKVMAGEIWHDLVLWALENDYGGLENMSLIPGNTGTAPIQNIGAYGVELKDIFVSCDAMEMDNQSLRKFNKDQCQFGYRDSFFKRNGKGKFIITSVTVRLTKHKHQINTSYGAIEEELEHMGIIEPTIKDVSNAVVAIRRGKLPDPNVLGNSGSFFKNPVLTKTEFETFISAHPKAKYYNTSDNLFKIPAGWLIEQCGYKGKRYGDAGVHQQQALVLVNYGNASGADIMDLANKIMESVYNTYQIRLLPEVNIIK